MPTYYQAGLLAPLLLLLIRLLQGLAVGGEFPGSIVLMYETSPKYKSVVITLVICGAMIGFFIATFLVAYFSKHMPHQQYLAWGWRVPFLLGIVLAIFGLYLRLKVFKDLLQKNTLRHRIPVLHLLKTHPKELIRGIIWMMVPAAYSAFFSVYVTTFLTKNLHYDYSFAVKVVMMILIVMMLSLLFSSYIVDKYKIYWQSLRWGAVAALVCTYPLFKLMTLGHGAWGNDNRFNCFIIRASCNIN